VAARTTLPRGPDTTLGARIRDELVTDRDHGVATPPAGRRSPGAQGVGEPAAPRLTGVNAQSCRPVPSGCYISSRHHPAVAQSRIGTGSRCSLAQRRRITTGISRQWAHRTPIRTSTPFPALMAARLLTAARFHICDRGLEDTIRSWSMSVGSIRLTRCLLSRSSRCPRSPWPPRRRFPGGSSAACATGLRTRSFTEAPASTNSLIGTTALTWAPPRNQLTSGVG